MRLALVRHALPERVDAVPAAGSSPGGADPGLTAHGHAQAARLVGALGGEEVTALVTSPMTRARATAGPLAAHLGLVPRVVADLREYDADDPRYVPVHEMARADPAGWERLLEGRLPAHVDEAAFRARVVAAVEGVVAAHPGGTVVVVAHAGVVNAYLTHVLGIARPLPFALDYTGVSRVIARRDGRRTVRSVNETAHVADLLDVG